MRSPTRITLGIAAAAACFALVLWPSFHLSLIAARETFRAAELVGIMNPKGALVGQIMGFNYQRDPAWVHGVVQDLSPAIGFGPALICALLIFDRVGFGPLRATLCGRCGRRLKHLSKPECPACGSKF